MGNILGLAGKKQSGKNTAANCIIGKYMMDLGIVRKEWAITTKGQLWISDLNGDERFSGVFDIQRDNESMRLFRAEHLDDFVKLYSYADILKAVCIEVLGLSREQCYGTDEQKNSITHLNWEDMPGVMNSVMYQSLLDIFKEVKYQDSTRADDIAKHFIVKDPGPMTGREVLQYVGTNIFRRMYPNVWVDSTIRQIQQDNPELAIICDVRFPNEVTRLQELGGKVMRFTRDPYKGQDQHDSETALDPDKFDWTKFDWICENDEMGIPEQNKFVLTNLILEGWLLEIIEMDK